jgi:CDGSH-type Zn-finger protein
MMKPATGKQITISMNGPYVVTGGVPLAPQTIGVDAEGESVKWVEGTPYPRRDSYALCRCGQSRNKPYCDGSHSKAGFDGTETADRSPYREQAETVDGPAMSLTDAESLCAFGRFCDPNGRVWNMVAGTDDPDVRANFIRQVGDCPAGRLVAWDKQTGKAVEPHLEPSIGLVEDPQRDCSGPIWVRGGITIVGADGIGYEVRNRVTLCRCGQSQNKPFCDGTHAAVQFKAT